MEAFAQDEGGDSQMARFYAIARILVLAGCGYFLLGIVVPWLSFVNDGAAACDHQLVNCTARAPIYTAVTMSLWQYAHIELASYLEFFGIYTFEALAASAIPYALMLVAGTVTLRNNARPLPALAWILCLLFDLGSLWVLGLEARLFAISKNNPLYWQHFPQNPLSLVIPFATTLIFLFILILRRPSPLLRRVNRQQHVTISPHA
jgi:hypothetical protein